MKASNVRQPIDAMPESSRPRISFTQATRARFVWRAAHHAVGTCSLEILTEFMMHHAAMAGLPHWQLVEISELLATYQDLGRWQSVDTALTYGVPLPLEAD